MKWSTLLDWIELLLMTQIVSSKSAPSVIWSATMQTTLDPTGKYNPHLSAWFKTKLDYHMEVSYPNSSLFISLNTGSQPCVPECFECRGVAVALAEEAWWEKWEMQSLPFYSLLIPLSHCHPLTPSPFPEWDGKFGNKLALGEETGGLGRIPCIHAKVWPPLGASFIWLRDFNSIGAFRYQWDKGCILCFIPEAADRWFL